MHSSQQFPSSEWAIEMLPLALSWENRLLLSTAAIDDRNCSNSILSAFILGDNTVARMIGLVQARHLGFVYFLESVTAVLITYSCGLINNTSFVCFWVSYDEQSRSRFKPEDVLISIDTNNYS